MACHLMRGVNSLSFRVLLPDAFRKPALSGGVSHTFCHFVFTSMKVIHPLPWKLVEVGGSGMEVGGSVVEAPWKLVEVAWK